MKLCGRGFTRQSYFRRQPRRDGGKNSGRHRLAGERGTSVVRRLLRASQTYGYARRLRPRRVREVPRNQEILARGGTLRQQRRADREKCSRNRGWSAAFGKPAWRGREERLRPARSRRC